METEKEGKKREAEINAAPYKPKGLERKTELAPSRVSVRTQADKMVVNWKPKLEIHRGRGLQSK